jgi:hypothetical protein
MNYTGQYPRWRYSRVTLTPGIIMLKKELDPGHDWLLFGIIAKVPPIHRVAVLDISDDIQIELIQPERHRPLIDSPGIEIPLISSPAHTEPDGRDRGIKYYHNIDYLFSYSDIFKVNIIVPNADYPAYVDILALGRNLRREGGR